MAKKKLYEVYDSDGHFVCGPVPKDVAESEVKRLDKECARTEPLNILQGGQSHDAEHELYGDPLPPRTHEIREGEGKQ